LITVQKFCQIYEVFIFDGANLNVIFGTFALSVFVLAKTGIGLLSIYLHLKQFKIIRVDINGMVYLVEGDYL
jgi:hypothetical protein